MKNELNNANPLFRSRLYRAIFPGLPLLVLGMLTACGPYKHPSLSQDPAGMSGQTLCYRYASARDPALGDEIARRDLDCASILADDPLYGGM